MFGTLKRQTINEIKKWFLIKKPSYGLNIKMFVLLKGFPKVVAAVCIQYVSCFIAWDLVLARPGSPVNCPGYNPKNMVSSHQNMVAQMAEWAAANSKI